MKGVIILCFEKILRREQFLFVYMWRGYSCDKTSTVKKSNFMLLYNTADDYRQVEVDFSVTL